MKSIKIEHCLLQAILDTGNRVTVGILHWDGTSMRFASNLRHVPADFRRLDALRYAVMWVRDVVTTLPAGSSIGAAVVATCENELLCWSGVGHARTTHPKEHFEQAVAALRLGA